jgi:general secretion pathway protein E
MTTQLAYSMLSDEQRKRFETSKELDFSFGIKGLSRFRANCFLQRGVISVAIRQIPYEIMQFDRLGLPPVVRDFTNAQKGILLVTGPTGSGKTTTLYGAIRRLDHSTTNIMTVEDPIEYDLEGIGQTQVNPKIDMTFARALRSILRQDPDVVMVGEIRDLETAQIAVQASLTGHLVLATLHTNDAASAVTRLIDMGIEPFLLSSSLLGVLGQRLVRKLCPHCKKPEAGGNGFVPVGCDTCSHTGYIGRTGIYELLNVDEPMRLLIHQGVNDTDIRRAAERAGMMSMRSDGLRWVLAGVTAHEEVVRVTRE